MSCKHHPNERRRRRRRPLPDRSFALALLALALPAASSGQRPPRLVPDDKEDAPVAPVQELRRTAYYGPHRLNDRHGLALPSNVDYTKLTRINYGPFQINVGGSIWGTDVNADPQLLFGPYDWNAGDGSPEHCHYASADNHPRCARHHYEEGLIGGAHGEGGEVYASVGGRGWSEDFSEMAASPEGRAKFAQNAARMMTTYAFDGIDIAWQFPQSAEAMSNYSLLLSEVRLALDDLGRAVEKQFGLTVALPCNAFMEHIDVHLLNSVVSEFNLLSFDFHGPTDDEAGVNAPLYNPNGNDGASIDGCVRRYMDGGAPRDKLNIGLAFYGHSFKHAASLGEACEANWAGSCGDMEAWRKDGGSPQYHSIYSHMPEMAQYYDEESRTPWATYDGGVVSFDDPRSMCLKTDYALSHKLGGVVVQDLGGDMLGDKSTPLLDAINFKLRQPDVDCEGSEFDGLFAWREVAGDNPHGNGEASASLQSDVASVESTSSSGRVATYRYTCGIGEGNARDRCTSSELEDISCEHGTCPSDMLCFVVLCTKSRDGDVVLEEDKEETPAKSAYSKPLPKAKPRRKPRPTQESDTKSALREEMEVTDDSGRTMTHSCGTHFDHAKSCGTPCPNGQRDCPNNQFCFWLECDATAKSDADPDVSIPAATSTSANAQTLVTEMKYQCGETRDDALMCLEDCGFAWNCPDGKDCYNVPCAV